MSFIKALTIHAAAVAIVAAPVVGMMALICWLCVGCETVGADRIDDDPQTIIIWEARF